MGLWKDIESKFIYGETVIQIVSYIRRNEVDAGFIFASDLKRGGGEVFEISRLSMQTRPTYSVAALKQSRNQELSQKFVDLVLSKTGQAIMEKYGFIRFAGVLIGPRSLYQFESEHFGYGPEVLRPQAQ